MGGGGNYDNIMNMYGVSKRAVCFILIINSYMQ
jgi:hypothetical protein